MSRGRTVAALAALTGAVAVAIASWALHALQTPAHGPAAVPLSVARGARLRPVLEQLADARVLEHPYVLYVYARLRRQDALKSGHYELAGDQTPLQILDVLHHGRVALEPLTLVEGLNRWQVRELLAAAEWMPRASFDALCDDPAFLAANQVPGPSCEGYLYPDTYKFARGTAPAELLATMVAAYRREAAAVARVAGDGPLHLGPHQLATLASIVEKETGVPSERPRIACVFYNRLRARPPWRLETDPTVIYAATLADPHFNGNLTRAHLRALSSPYNTYRVFGLPPGPIANFGHAALLAVAQPATCDDFFFVSNNRGAHVFCPTLACHAQAVQRWQVDYFRRAAAAPPPPPPPPPHPASKLPL